MVASFFGGIVSGLFFFLIFPSYFCFVKSTPRARTEISQSGAHSVVVYFPWNANPCRKTRSGEASSSFSTILPTATRMNNEAGAGSWSMKRDTSGEFSFRVDGIFAVPGGKHSWIVRGVSESSFSFSCCRCVCVLMKSPSVRLHSSGIAFGCSVLYWNNLDRRALKKKKLSSVIQFWLLRVLIVPKFREEK